MMLRAGSTLTGYDGTEGSWEAKNKDTIITKYNNVEYQLKFDENMMEAVAMKIKIN